MTFIRPASGGQLKRKRVVEKGRRNVSRVLREWRNEQNIPPPPSRSAKRVRGERKDILFNVELVDWYFLLLEKIDLKSMLPRNRE